MPICDWLDCWRCFLICSTSSGRWNIFDGERPADWMTRDASSASMLFRDRRVDLCKACSGLHNLDRIPCLCRSGGEYPAGS